MKRALVLSGGGAKGSYQLGVYKALKIVVEAINWSGHIPEVLQVMLDNVKGIKAEKEWKIIN